MFKQSFKFFFECKIYRKIALFGQYLKIKYLRATCKKKKKTIKLNKTLKILINEKVIEYALLNKI